MSQGSGTTGGPDNQPEPRVASVNRDDGTTALPPRLIPKPVMTQANQKMPGWLVGNFAVLALVVIAVHSIL